MEHEGEVLRRLLHELEGAKIRETSRVDITRRGRIGRLRAVEECTRWTLGLVGVVLTRCNLDVGGHGVVLIQDWRILGAPLLEADVLQGFDDELGKVR